MEASGRRVLGVCLLAAATGGGIAAAVVSSGSASAAFSPARTVELTCRSSSLGGGLPAVVYLPKGYAHSSTRYPAIYFLHGLPADPDDYTTNSFVAHAVAAAGRRAIVVTPQGSRAKDSDREYLDWAPDENWPAAISGDLTRCIDARFRTIANRNGRALIGLSAGGYGAFNIGFRHLSVFSAVESWSGYFAATDPSGLVVLDLGSARANRWARVPRGQPLVYRLTRRPTFIGFYVGSQDKTFLQANIDMNKALSANGIPHKFAIYPGGHDTSLWQRWAPLWLGYALDRMARPKD